MKSARVIPPQLTALLLLVLLLVQCHVRPSNVLSREKMRDVLRDMTLTETYLDGQYTPDSIRVLHYESVFKKHHISRADYDSSLVWYAKNTPILNGIYSELMTEFQNNATALDSALVDSTRLFRIRYEAPQSLWTNSSRIVIPSEHRLFMLTQYMSSTDTSLAGGDTLDLSLHLTPLDSLQELHFALFAKDSAGQIAHRERQIVPCGKQGYTHAFALPDSLPEKASLLLQLLYLSRRDTTRRAYPPVLLDSITLLRREPVELPTDSLTTTAPEQSPTEEE